MNHNVLPNALEESRELVKLDNALECLKNTLRSTSRTAKGWLQCMDYIEVVKYFICCDRLGLGDRHTVIALLNLFAAIVHIHYYHTVRRSERLRERLWTDIVIQ